MTWLPVNPTWEFYSWWIAPFMWYCFSLVWMYTVSPSRSVFKHIPDDTSRLYQFPLSLICWTKWTSEKEFKKENDNGNRPSLEYSQTYHILDLWWKWLEQESNVISKIIMKRTSSKQTPKKIFGIWHHIFFNHENFLSTIIVWMVVNIV